MLHMNYQQQNQDDIIQDQLSSVSNHSSNLNNTSSLTQICCPTYSNQTYIKKEIQIPIDVTTSIVSEQKYVKVRAMRQNKLRTLSGLQQYADYMAKFHTQWTVKLEGDNQQSQNNCLEYSQTQEKTDAAQKQGELEIYDQYQFVSHNIQQQQLLKNFYECCEGYEWKVITNKQRLTQLKQKEQQLQQTGPIINKTKYHNKNKLFFNCILRALGKDNLENLRNMPVKQQNLLNEVMERCKKSGIKVKKGDNERVKIEKTDGFNHTHYRLLFMPIEQQNFNQIRNMSQDCQLNKFVFGIDFSSYQKFQDIPQNIIRKINFVKYSYGQLFEIYIEQVLIDNAIYMGDSIYEERACKGIAKLRQGIVVTRF